MLSHGNYKPRSWNLFSKIVHRQSIGINIGPGEYITEISCSDLELTESGECQVFDAVIVLVVRSPVREKIIRMDRQNSTDCQFSSQLCPC